MDWYEGGCRLCPRECGADRGNGRMGVCRETAEVRVARAALHFWEEPCISGEEGSGAVFFAGCPLRCIYCQNYEISGGLPGEAEPDRTVTDRALLPEPGRGGAPSQLFCTGSDRASVAGSAFRSDRASGAGGDSVSVRTGKIVTVPRLASVFLALQAQGANNINLVTACHFVPQVRASLLLARKSGLNIPVVYNSSGYEKAGTLRLLEGLVDIYLPDFKYLDESLAARYSKAPDYPAVAAAALAEMVRQCPDPVFDARGRMVKGVIVRHLLLPGHVREAKRVTRYLHETYGNHIYISLLNQYTPEPAVRDDPLLGRKVTRREYGRLLDYAVEIGVEQGFFQEDGTAAGSYTPAFDNTGVEQSGC